MATKQIKQGCFSKPAVGYIICLSDSLMAKHGAAKFAKKLLEESGVDSEGICSHKRSNRLAASQTGRKSRKNMTKAAKKLACNLTRYLEWENSGL